MAVLIKAGGTVLITVLLTYPLWSPQWGLGVLGEVVALGMPGGLIAAAVFLGLVALYCRSLHRVMSLARPEARASAPAAVWWMFAIPYNFTEDFFIVRNVSATLTGDSRLPAGFIRWWTTLGYGWCVFQVLSLFPGSAGYVGGAIAIPLWIAHWHLTHRASRAMSVHRDPAPLAVSGV